MCRLLPRRRRARSSSSGTTGTVTGAGSGLFVRSGPGSGNEAIATILEGNTVTILEDMGNGWYRISFIGSGGRATEGYVSKRLYQGLLNCCVPGRPQGTARNFCSFRLDKIIRQL